MSYPMPQRSDVDLTSAIRPGRRSLVEACTVSLAVPFTRDITPRVGDGPSEASQFAKSTTPPSKRSSHALPRRRARRKRLISQARHENAVCQV